MQVIGEDRDGLPDMQQLELELQKHSSAPLIVGSFSAGSNVTGIAPDVHKISALLHRHGAVAAFDYASAGSCKKVLVSSKQVRQCLSNLYCTLELATCHGSCMSCALTLEL